MGSIAGNAGVNTIMRSLNRLATHGWIPLRALAPLLGYKYPTGIYARQRGKNAIPTIQVGGTIRVYEEAVLDALRNVPEQDQEAARNIIQLYNSTLKNTRIQEKDDV